MTGHPRRRHTDRGLHRLVRENWYRDLWLLIITGFALYALWLGQHTLQQQAKGRRFAVGFTCAALSAISDAGRQVLVGAQHTHDTPFERALEKLGYPPLPVRRKQAQAAATLYVDGISARVDHLVGDKGARLIRHDGTIDCRELQRLSNTRVGH